MYNLLTQIDLTILMNGRLRIFSTFFFFPFLEFRFCSSPEAKKEEQKSRRVMSLESHHTVSVVKNNISGWDASRSGRY